jgi:hypothetical protein
MMIGRCIFSGEHYKWLTALSSMVLLCTIPIAAQQTVADNSQSQSPEQHAITGRVINESGQPLAGVSIFIRTIGASSGHQTATDGEGNFRAQGLDPGTYQIMANLPAYIMDTPPGDASIPATYYRPGDSATLTLIKGGVITGIVTNSAGEPLVNANVRALRVRDAEGKPVRSGNQARERPTDDRGYYRIYGLLAGSYIVSVGGPGQSYGVINPYARQAPTYSPASTRDTAVEIIVRSGEQATADIRDRGEFGHSISGRINGPQTQSIFGAGVRLTDIESHSMISGASATSEDRTFQLNGVSDGDYEISAISGAGPNTELTVSPVRRISVRGADVTGIELNLATLASINGRVNIETDAQQPCGRHREVALRETLITLRLAPVAPETKNPKDKPIQTSESLSFLPPFTDAAPNDKGEISLRNLSSGVYRFETRIPGGGWYVKAITTGPNGPNIPRDGIALKSGDKVTGLTITITEGGARLRGRIAVAEGQSLPPGLRVFVVPAERDSAENVLRFFEASAASDGSFAIGNIAPGKYLIIARPVEGSDPGTIKSIKQDPTFRSKVLKEAEALKKEISFKPCEQAKDFELPWPAALPK